MGPIPDTLARMVRSPCIDVCRMNEALGLCEGCGRTLDEIARWAQMSDAERDRIMAELPGRRAARTLPQA